MGFFFLYLLVRIINNNNKKPYTTILAGSFKSQLIDYFRGAITSWELVEGSLWQFYDNET